MLRRKYYKLGLLFFLLNLIGGSVAAQTQYDSYGLFSKRQDNLDQQSLKWGSFFVTLPNGVSENWLPGYFVIESWTSGNGITGNTVKRTYDGHTIKQEIEYENGDSNFYKKWDYELDSLGGEIKILTEGKSFCCGGIFQRVDYSRENWLEGGDFFKYSTIRYVSFPDSTKNYSVFDSSITRQLNGFFKGQTVYADPYINPNNLIYVDFDEVIPVFDSEVQFISKDSALFVEQFYNGSGYDVRTRYASLKDSVIHTVYQVQPFSGYSTFQKVVFDSWHDASIFQAKEWTTYKTTDSGMTWVPFMRNVVDGVEDEWKITQDFRFIDGQWRLKYERLYNYYPYSGRLKSWISSDSVQVKYSRELIATNISVDGKILTEEVIYDNKLEQKFTFYNHVSPSAITQPTTTPFHVYPNPCSDVIHFSQGSGNAKLYSLSGQLLREMDMGISKHNVRDLAPGLYRIVSEDGFVVGVVKE